jgi:uncharacterized membrane protein
MSQTHIQEHIDVIAKHEQEFLAQRTHPERLVDNIALFAGSVAFVSLHLVLFGAWIAWNVAPHVRHFDPAPFSLLGTLVALEAILLASLILTRQSRMGRRSDEREHLMLQILLLMEKEVTAVLKMDRQIAAEIGLEQAANNPEARVLSQPTSVDHMARTIKDNLPADE